MSDSDTKTLEMPWTAEDCAKQPAEAALVILRLREDAARLRTALAPFARFVFGPKWVGHEEIAQGKDPAVIFGYDAEGNSTGLHVLFSDFVRAQKVLKSASPVMVNFLDWDEAHWGTLKSAMAQAPRFSQMLAAGGTLDDVLSEILAWLIQPEDRRARIARKVRKMRERVSTPKRSSAGKQATNSKARRRGPSGRTRNKRRVV